MTAWRESHVPGLDLYFLHKLSGEYIPTQLSQRLQCEALGGLNILHV